MSHRRLLDKFLARFCAENPSFKQVFPKLAERECGEYLVQSISLSSHSKAAGAFHLSVGWQFFFDPDKERRTAAFTFDLETLIDPEYRQYMTFSVRSREATEASLETVATWLADPLLPMLDRLDSLEKLVAAYDAETDLTPVWSKLAPTRFNSRAGFYFGISANRRRYNLAHSLAHLGRLPEAIEQIEAQLRDHPAEPDIEWQVELERRARAKLEEWRRALADSRG